MARIIVFDSGFGSLSIIKPIQQAVKSDIIYFADQKNFPYGQKSKSELTKKVFKWIDDNAPADLRLANVFSKKRKGQLKLK